MKETDKEHDKLHKELDHRWKGKGMKETKIARIVKWYLSLSKSIIPATIICFLVLVLIFLKLVFNVEVGDLLK